jgi:PilZ domain
MDASLTQMAPQGPPAAYDRRRHDRLPTRLAIRFTAIDGVATAQEGICTDVSIGGIGIDTAVLLRPGQIVAFEFPGIEDCPLHFRARILYRNGDHYGAFYMDVE